MSEPRAPMMSGERLPSDRPCILYTHRGTLLGVQINGVKINDTFRYLKIEVDDSYWLSADGHTWFPLEERHMVEGLGYTMEDLEKRLHGGEITEVVYKRLKKQLEDQDKEAGKDG